SNPSGTSRITPNPAKAAAAGGISDSIGTPTATVSGSAWCRMWSVATSTAASRHRPTTQAIGGATSLERPTRASVATARSRAPGGIVIGANGTRGGRRDPAPRPSYACLVRRNDWRRSDALEQLTGVRLGEWAALGALAVGVGLVLQASWALRRGGASSGSLLGLASGAVIVAIVLGRDLDGLARLPGALVARPAAIVVAVVTIAVALALVDVAFLRGRRVLDWLLGRAGVPTGPRADA